VVQRGFLTTFWVPLVPTFAAILFPQRVANLLGYGDIMLLTLIVCVREATKIFAGVISGSPPNPAVRLHLEPRQAVGRDDLNGHTQGEGVFELPTELVRQDPGAGAA